MKTKKEIIQIQQYDTNIPIEFFRIENSLEWFDYGQHYQYDFYQIYWFTETINQHHEIDFISYPIEPNQIWIIYPGQVHYIEATSIVGYCLAINKNYFHRILYKYAKQSSFIGNTHLKFKVTPSMGKLLEHLHILIEMEFTTLKRPIMLEKYLQLYIIHIQDLPLIAEKHISIDNRIHTLLELIEEYYITERKNEFYAQRVALSTKRMNEILLSSIGKTLKQQLQDRLLLEAKRLVGYSDDTIQSIAYKLHFSEVSYFNRFFKKQTQQTPMQFRERVKKVQV